MRAWGRVWVRVLLLAVLWMAGTCRDAWAQAAPAPAEAGTTQDASTWTLRVRHLRLDPDIVDTIGLFVGVEPLTFTELDLTWSPRRDVGIELAITWPQTHRVLSAGFEVGRLRQLPPTLVLLWRPVGGRVRPYVGAGFSYTQVSNLRFAPEYSATLQPTVRNHSLGGVLAVGLDVGWAGRWSFNLDAKRLQLKTDLARVGDLPGEFRVRPLLLSAGLGFRF